MVTPLLMIVFGIMQYAFYFYSMQGGADAARHAARIASIGTMTSCGAFRDDVTKVLSVSGARNLTARRIYAKASGNTGAGTQIGDEVSVTVTFDSLDFNLPWTPMPNDGTVVSTAKTRVDYVPDSTIASCP